MSWKVFWRHLTRQSFLCIIWDPQQFPPPQFEFPAFLPSSLLSSFPAPFLLSSFILPFLPQLCNTTFKKFATARFRSSFINPFSGLNGILRFFEDLPPPAATLNSSKLEWLPLRSLTLENFFFAFHVRQNLISFFFAIFFLFSFVLNFLWKIFLSVRRLVSFSNVSFVIGFWIHW